MKLKGIKLMRTLIRLAAATAITLGLVSAAGAQIPGGSDIQINRTPVVGGTNGNCLYIATGKVYEETREKAYRRFRFHPDDPRSST